MVRSCFEIQLHANLNLFAISESNVSKPLWALVYHTLFSTFDIQYFIIILLLFILFYFLNLDEIFQDGWIVFHLILLSFCLVISQNLSWFHYYGWTRLLSSLLIPWGPFFLFITWDEYIFVLTSHNIIECWFSTARPPTGWCWFCDKETRGGKGTKRILSISVALG